MLNLKGNNKKEECLSSSSSLPIKPQWPGLGQYKARSQGFHGWENHMSRSHHWLPRHIRRHP